MNSENNTNAAPSTSLLNPFHLIGGLLSDVVEATKYVGNEISDIPTALAEGWENGAILNTDNTNKTNFDTELEIVALKAKLAELEQQTTTSTTTDQQ
jgi:hypothetical protein